MHLAYQQNQKHILCVVVQVEEEIASGPHELESSFARTGPRSARGGRPCTPIPRRGSASNMLDQSIIQVSLHPYSFGQGLALLGQCQFQHVFCIEETAKGTCCGSLLAMASTFPGPGTNILNVLLSTKVL